MIVSIATCHSDILSADISDHFPVFCILNQLNVIRETKYINISDHGFKNLSMFKKYIAKSNWVSYL